MQKVNFQKHAISKLKNRNLGQNERHYYLTIEVLTEKK